MTDWPALRGDSGFWDVETLQAGFTPPGRDRAVAQDLIDKFGPGPPDSDGMAAGAHVAAIAAQVGSRKNGHPAQKGGRPREQDQ